MPNSTNLVIWGDLPTKKNRLRPRKAGSRGRRYHYDDATAAEINSIVTQARMQWGTRKEVAHPKLDVRLWIHNSAKDVDGIYTTLLDALKQARVIWDDSAKWLNGGTALHPVVFVPNVRQERAEITLTMEDE
jgi:hypothetical protein